MLDKRYIKHVFFMLNRHFVRVFLLSKNIIKKTLSCVAEIPTHKLLHSVYFKFCEGQKMPPELECLEHGKALDSLQKNTSSSKEVFTVPFSFDEKGLGSED